MRLSQFIVALLPSLLLQPAFAFVSEELEVPAEGGVRAAFTAPFEAAEVDAPIGAITLVRQGVTGQVRVRAESCAELMDVYPDGDWQVEAQDSVYYTNWLIARCQTLSILVQNEDRLNDWPLLLDDDSADRLPAHFAPYRDCLTLVGLVKSTIRNETMATAIAESEWEFGDEISTHEISFEGEGKDRLVIELLAAYFEERTSKPVWLLLVSQTDGQTAATRMTVWSVTAAAQVQSGAAYGGPLLPTSSLALVQKALSICPSFLPSLLDETLLAPECGE